jgi:hypothetical protein
VARPSAHGVRVAAWAVVGTAAAGSFLLGTGSAATPSAFSAPLDGASVGNARPAVSVYDGQLVRRCEAVAVWADDPSGIDALRRELHAQAEESQVRLLDLPAGVVAPATLAVGIPDVVACLPWDVEPDRVSQLLPRPLPGQLRTAQESVLVHDLVLGVRPTTGISDAIAALDQEGMLADLLGEYAVDGSGPAGELTVRYTGPLLSDAEVEAVRAAIGRAAGTTAAAVAVGPGPAPGPGIELPAEPEPADPETTGPAGPAADADHGGH